MNAKQELIQLIDIATIKCALISNEGDIYQLPVKHTKAELVAFIESLDFKYNHGFGTQELFGTIWLNDGSWLTRDEYDGSEWWGRYSLPDIPTVLL